jgi:hypothetical protein
MSYEEEDTCHMIIYDFGLQGMSCTWDVTKAIKKHYNFQ